MIPERQYRLITPRTAANTLARSTGYNRTRVPMTTISLSILRSACALLWHGSKAWITKGTHVPGFGNLNRELGNRGPGCALAKGGRLDEAPGLVQPFTERGYASNHAYLP